MQKISPPTALSFSEFLAVLLQSFDEEGLRPCILRNYEGFPDSNFGSDVDFLIRRSDLARFIRAIKSLDGIRIVGYAERHYVAHMFVEGVSPAAGVRALELDFIWALNWKGVEYLSTEDVLQAAMPRQAGELSFLVPSPVHEAIISLLSSLLIGGWLKEKYFPKVHRTFAGGSFEVTAALSPKFGMKSTTRLVDSVIAGNRQRMLGCVMPLRISLVLRSLLREPMRSVLASVRYHLREFMVRCTPVTLETVCVLGLDTEAKAAIIEELMPMLRNSAKIVETSQFGPQLSSPRGLAGNNAITESSANDRRRPSASMAKVVLWVVEEWISLFRKRDNLTLRVDTSGYFGLLFESQNNWLTIPLLSARVIGTLLPPIDLLVALDGTGDSVPLGNRQTSPEKAQSSDEDRLGMMKARKRCVVLNKSRPSPDVAEEVYAAIIDTLVQITDSKLKSRF